VADAKNQGWQEAAEAYKVAKAKEQAVPNKIVIRHPPEPLFRQVFDRHLLALKIAQPQFFVEIQERTPDKDKVPDQKRSSASEQVIIVNQANFHRLFCGSFGGYGLSKKLQALPAILDHYGRRQIIAAIAS
jgi:hypothetical protein